MRARKYFEELTGHQGNVIGHNVSPELLAEKFSKAKLINEEQVKHFLDKLTYDKKGCVQSGSIFFHATDLMLK
jgi:hypothetical protein